MGEHDRRIWKEKAIGVDVEVGGARYLVSARGEAAWVRNLRAAGGKAELRAKGKTASITTTEIPVADASPIIEAYRKRAGRTVESYWKKLPAAADHPVFKLL